LARPALIRANIAPMTGDSTDAGGVGPALRDALERLRVAELALHNERALRDDQSATQAMLDALPAMIWFKDTENRVVRVNRAAAALEGVTPEALQGRTCWELYPKAQADAYFADDRDVIESRRPKLGIVEAHRAVGTGSERWLEVSKVPVTDRGGHVIGVVAMAIDVTEKRRMQQVLQDVQRLESLGVLAGGIAHDFNNLLAAAFGWMERARDAADCGPRARHDLAQATSAFERARSLTGQLITFARGGTPVVDAVDLASLLREVAGFILVGSAVHVEWRVGAALPPCRADRGQLAQVFDNLLLNARDALPRGGVVTITATLGDGDAAAPHLLAPGRYVHVVVADSGPGIPPEILPRVFDPFFTTKPKGTGMGLAIARKLVQEHGGTITAENVAPFGAKFTVWLPAE
jgi:PAS domain S-box-containing protein